MQWNGSERLVKGQRTVSERVVTSRGKDSGKGTGSGER